MKSYLFLLAVYLVFSLTQAINIKSNSDGLSGKKIKIAVLGDSISKGEGAHGGIVHKEVNSWPNRLQSMLNLYD
jgi:hypothetical protein